MQCIDQSLYIVIDIMHSIECIAVNVYDIVKVSTNQRSMAA